MTRHLDEPNINILLTRNLPFDSDVRKESHPLMIPFYAYNRTRAQFECDVLGFVFVSNSLTCSVRLLFHSLCSLAVCYHINIDGSIIKSSNSQKLLLVTSQYTVISYLRNTIIVSVENLVKKPHALSRISQYLSPNKKHILLKRL